MGLSRTVSERNGDFSRRSQIFPTPCILWLTKVVPLELGTGAWGQKTRMMRPPGRGRSLTIVPSRLDTMHQRDRLTDRHWATAKTAQL